MSDYISQYSISSSFGKNSISSFVVLSDIEKSIKEKIEKVGTPLKDWDINIYRGILTGFNEAFIIDGKTKDDLIAKSAKNAEIIRPILRGRDIKRYGYEFADLWLICTFPSLKIDIEEYPAVKEHLLSLGYDRLKQTGDKGARKKTSNKWFETQDSIGYWDDFNRQKILWAETMRIHKTNNNRFPRFSYDDKAFFTDKTCFFATGNHLKYIVAFLNSYIGQYLCSQYVSILDDGGYLMQKIYLESIPIPIVDSEFQLYIEIICDKIFQKQGVETNDLEVKIDKIFYDFYKLSYEEINFLELI